MAETKTVQFLEGWNMFSITVDRTFSISEVLRSCSVESYVWHYNSLTKAYEKVNTLRPGLGYWVKLKSPCIVTLEGEDIVTEEFQRQIDGWNQISSLSDQIYFSDMVEEGDCNIVSGPWKYNPITEEYEEVSVLDVGFGYWIKVEDDCYLNKTGQEDDCDSQCIDLEFDSGECVSGTASDSWVPSDAQVWFSTDFSATQKIWKSGTEVDFSDFPQPHWISYRVPDECYLFEELMGKRALKVTWGDTLIVDGENPRPEVLIQTSPNEYWLSMELYIPEDFKLKNWLSVGQAFTGKSGVFPRYASSIFLQGSGGDGSGALRIRNEVKYITEGYTVNILKTTGNLEGIVKRDATLTIQSHVKVDSVNGEYELWLNGEKVMDYRGQTATIADNYIFPIEHYKRVDEPVTSIWWKNLQIWSAGSGGSSTPTCSGTSIGQQDCPPGELCCCSGTATSSWLPDDAELWFSTDFENTKIINPDDRQWNGEFSDWDISHMIGRVHTMSIVADPVNSNNKVLRVLYGGKTVDDPPIAPLVCSYHNHDELWFSGWHYFPSDFGVVDWYMFASWGQWSAIYSQQYGNGMVVEAGFTISPNLDVVIEIHDFPEHVPGSRRYLLSHTKVGKIPLGKWFNIRYHLILDETNGLFEYWFDKPNGDEPSDIFYTGKTYEVIPDASQYTQVTFANHYSGEDNPEKYQYSDNFKVWVRQSKNKILKLLSENHDGINRRFFESYDKYMGEIKTKKLYSDQSGCPPENIVDADCPEGQICCCS